MISFAVKVDARHSLVAEPQAADEDEEFFPESTDANNLVLRRAAGDEASMSTLCDSMLVDADSDTSDTDLPSDLMGPDSVPGINDDSESSSADECELLNSNPEPSIAVASAKTPSTTGIRFRKDHFKHGSSPDSTSSSSDDEGITKGLDFKNVTMDQTDNNKSAALSALAAIQTMAKFQENVKGMILESALKLTQQAAESVPYLSDSSNDSEFEIINHDE